MALDSVGGHPLIDTSPLGHDKSHLRSNTWVNGKGRAVIVACRNWAATIKQGHDPVACII